MVLLFRRKFDALLCGEFVLVVSEAADYFFSVGVHYSELAAVCVFDFDGALVVSDREVGFAKLLGCLGQVEV